MVFLENPYCTFNVIHGILRPCSILSACLFKLKNGSYKDFKKYLDGLVIANDIALSLTDFDLYIFVDITITSDSDIMNFLKKLKKVVLIEYSCPNFIIQGSKFTHHIGTFGMLIRMFPMYDLKNNNTHSVIVIDADTNYLRIMAMIHLNEYIINKQLNDKIYMAYGGRYFHVCMNKSKPITVDSKRVFYPYVLGQKYIGFKKIPSKIMYDFLDTNSEYMNPENNLEILSDYNIKESEKNKRCENNLCFGLDEYFLNKILVKKLTDMKLPFCYRYRYNPIQFYFFANPEKNIDPSKEYKKIFSSYIYRFGLTKFTNKKISKNIFNVGYEYTENWVPTQLQIEFGKKMIYMLKTLSSEHDYRIFTEASLYAFNTSNPEKYFDVSYIKFVCSPIKDIILNHSDF